MENTNKEKSVYQKKMETENLPVYFKHEDACGTYYRRVWLKFNKNSATEVIEVTLLFEYGHMGIGKWRGLLKGIQLPIQGPYSVVVFHKASVYNEDGETIKEKNGRIAFDCYMFDHPLFTEWGLHTDEYSMALSYGNCPVFTDSFTMHMIRNKFIQYDNKITILDKLESLKYAVCSKEDFDGALGN